MPALLYYFAPGGSRWLVRDGRVQDGRFVALQLGHHYATHRVFDRKEPRERRAYRFHPEEQHAVNEAALDRQFTEARQAPSGECASA